LGGKKKSVAISMDYLTVIGITDALLVNGINRNGKLSLKYVSNLSSAINHQRKMEQSMFSVQRC